MWTYSSTDEYEVAHGEVVGPEGTVCVVVKRYDAPESSTDPSPIKFIPLVDIDGEYDLAIYMPQYMFDCIALDDMREGMKTLIFLGGITLHNAGPDAVSQLG